MSDSPENWATFYSGSGPYAYSGVFSHSATWVDTPSGYSSTPTLGIDQSAPWVMPLGMEGLAANLCDFIQGVSADERSWFGTLANGLMGAKPRRDVTVTIGDGIPECANQAVAMDSWRRDAVLKNSPALNASPVLNPDVIAEAGKCYTDYINSVELKGSILGEVLDNYVDGDVFIAPAFESTTGTIIDGLIRTLP